MRLAVSEDVQQFYRGETDYNDMYYDKDGLRVGRVDICQDGTYGTVCNENREDTAASVACAQLGFSPCGKQKKTSRIFANSPAM